MSEPEKKRLQVEIFGQTYKMVGSESSGHMRLVASMVDDKMRELHSQNASLDTATLAVLAAVNGFHDYLKLKQQVEQMETELKKLKG